MRMTESMRREEERKLKERVELVELAAQRAGMRHSMVSPVMNRSHVSFVCLEIKNETGGPLALLHLSDAEFDKEMLANSRYAEDTAVLMSQTIDKVRPLIEQRATADFQRRAREAFGIS